MTKSSGGSRTLKGGSREHNRRRTEFELLRRNGEYDANQAYFSEKGGGYILVERSSAKHKPEEWEAATALADKGYKVILTNEAGKGDNVKSPDGQIFSASFEQRTPGGDSARNFENCLRHARDKHADLAVVYMKNAGHTRQSVEQGIRDFESSSKYRFKEIIVVTKDGRIHRHKHNK